MKTTLTKTKALAEMIGARVTLERPKNGYGGYDDYNDYIWYEKETGKARFITTCMNCGDGNWTDMTKVANSILLIPKNLKV